MRTDFRQVMAHAREEYLFQYSVYVLESCTSRRLTYFLPPTNLIPLLFIRPLRLFLPSDTVRRIRILLLRCVSIPFVALIWCYESSSRMFSGDRPSLAKTRIRSLTKNKPARGPSRVSTLGIGPALRILDQPTTFEAQQQSVPLDSKHESDNSLTVLVQRLSTQVEELTALVAAQKAD